MEELRSADVLDSEIEADARKKVERILKDADRESEKVLADVATRIETAKNEKKEYYDAKVCQYKKDLEASVPLENERFLVSFIGSSVIESINRYLEDIGFEKRLGFLSRLVDKYKAVAGTKKLRAVVFGFRLEAAEELLKSKFGQNVIECKMADNTSFYEESVAGLKFNEGIVLESEDGDVKFRATLDELINEVMDKYNGELAETLFGGRLPE